MKAAIGRIESLAEVEIFQDGLDQLRWIQVMSLKTLEVSLGNIHGRRQFNKIMSIVHFKIDSKVLVILKETLVKSPS